MTARTVLWDSDGLIAYFKVDDPLHKKARQLAACLEQENAKLFCGSTTLAESMATFQRRFDDRELSEKLYQKVVDRVVEIIPVDLSLTIEAFKIFSGSRSKHNTFFDAINVAIMKSLNLDAIFSFDRWYEKHKIRLAEKLLMTSS